MAFFHCHLPSVGNHYSPLDYYDIYFNFFILFMGFSEGDERRGRKKGMTEDAMVGWHHWLKGHEFEKTLGVGDGQ